MKSSINISQWRIQDCQLWKVGVVSTLLIIPIISVFRVFAGSGRPPLNADAAFYEHAGWYLLNGGIPYIDMWDPKPPLNFLITGLSALLGNGNMLITHSINVSLTVFAASGACIFILLTTFELTDDPTASAVAGVFPMLLPHFHYLPAYGYRPKYYLLFFGFLGIFLAIRGRYFSSALSAGLSIGFWQFGFVFIAIVFGITLLEYKDSGNLSQIYSILLGFGIAALIILLPVIIWGALREMLVQTIYASIVTTNQQSIIERIGVWVYRMGIANIAVGFAVLGLIVALIKQETKWWWGYFGVAVGTIQILLLDFEGYNDMYLTLLFLSFGIGLFIHYVDDFRSVVVGVVIVSLFISVFLLGGTGIVFESASPASPDSTNPQRDSEPLFKTGLGAVRTILTDKESSTQQIRDRDGLSPPYKKSYMVTIYWDKIKPETCHYRVGGMHRSWIEHMDKSYDEAHCGQL